MAVDINPLKEEIGWKGVAGMATRPVKAPVFLTAAMCWLPRLYYPPTNCGPLPVGNLWWVSPPEQAACPDRQQGKVATKVATGANTGIEGDDRAGTGSC